jgi:hypothetical protein
VGKFGKHNLPTFVQYEKDNQVEETNENLAEILGMGEHGNDFAKITIRTEDGEEVELEFTYDGDGMIHAEHNDKTYSIPVEVEVETSVSEEEPEHEDHESDDTNEEDDAEGKAHTSFTDFLNECWSPVQEGYNIAMSEEAKRAVKTICEQILIKEAKACHEDSDEMHTYENYLNECGQYMTECMMEAAANMNV